MNWQPIETAPKSGLILLYRPKAPNWGAVAPGAYESDTYAKKPHPYWSIWLKIGGIREAREWEPTHWMHLPSPPEGLDKARE